MQSSRRRRKRRRLLIADGGNTNTIDHHVNRRRSSESNFDNDESLAFLDEQGDALSDRQTIQCCICTLLEERRTGWKHPNRRQIASFQSRALSNFTKKTNDKNCRRQWRKYAKRSIPFTQLGTPISNAVLALERKGSYVLCLGSKNENDVSNVPLSLALRFYSVPSPSGVQRRRTPGRSPSTTPLLAMVPLLYDALVTESAEESIFNFRRNISPASTPVNLLISSDWNIGMAMFQPYNVWREEGPVGTLVLFSLPQNHNRRRTTRVSQCINVRMGATSSFTLRNLLWRVEGIPRRSTANSASSSSLFFDSVLNLPGYVLFNDEEDGFRISWAVDQWGYHETECIAEMNGSPLTAGIDCPSPILSVQETWETFHSDLQTGQRVLVNDNDSDQPGSGGVMIANEIFLHVDTLLGQIMDRHKKFSSKSPEFLYNLVCVTEKGRIAELVITWLRKIEKHGSLGVFVHVDLFTGTFQELDWVKSTIATNTSALRRWSNTLALNRRMKQLRAGPFSINSTSNSRDWGRLCKESYFDPDEADDYDASVWLEYIANVQKKRPPKCISFSSLYPDCDLVNNSAITSCLPVSSLKCKDSPIQLVYG